MTPPAYIVLAHRLPHQLGRLVRALGPASPVLLHVDSRADIAVAAEARREPNVTLLRRHRCRWAGWGHLAGTLEGLYALADVGFPGEHVVLMSGQDFPLRAAEEIEAYLGERAGRSFLEIAPLPKEAWAAERGGLDRYERTWFHVAGRQRSLPFARPAPAGLRLHAGSSYWVIAREAAEWVVAEARRRPGLLRWFRTVRAPDEMFFHTLLMSGPFAETVENDPLRWLVFPPGGKSPKVFTAADLPALRALPDSALWARKFDEGQDGAVLDALEAGMLPR